MGVGFHASICCSCGWCAASLRRCARSPAYLRFTCTYPVRHVACRGNYPEDSFERDERERGKRDLPFRGSGRRDRKDGSKPGPMSFKEYMMNEVDDDCDPEEAKKRYCWWWRHPHVCLLRVAGHSSEGPPPLGAWLQIKCILALKGPPLCVWLRATAV